MHPLQGGHDLRLVLAVGHAVPAGGAAEHLHGGRALLQHAVDHAGDEVLRLHGVRGGRLPQEAREALLHLTHQAGREAEHVHAHRRFAGEEMVGCAVLGVEGAVAAGDDVCALGHGGQESLLVHAAYAAGDGAVLRQRVGELVADHEITGDSVVLQAGKGLVGGLVGLGAVVVVGVDDQEGRVDVLGAAQQRVAGAPGLHAALGDGKAVRQHVQLLVGVGHVHVLLDPLAYQALEVLLNLVLDEEDHALKARALCVVYAVIKDGLARGAHGVHLLQSAVARAHARREDDENGFLHAFCLLSGGDRVRAAVSFHHTPYAGKMQPRL